MKEIQKLHKSKIGKMYICANDDGITGVLWSQKEVPKVQLGDKSKASKHIQCAIDQIDEFLLRKRKEFDLPLVMNGTLFQQKVWRELLKIPYGEVRSYLDIAKKIKNPKATRAVGSANGKNPISIVVPCHRVIRSSGEMSGYAGGVKRKESLLEIENSIC